MKKLIAGICFIFSGIILFGITYIPSSKYMINLGQWGTPPGKFMTSVIETGGLLPFITGILLFLIGLIFLLCGTFEK